MALTVIGVAGLPGSGKSALLHELQGQGYARIDDINRDWASGIASLRGMAQHEGRVAVCDIVFCDRYWRRRFEIELGVPVRWSCMENAPWRCAINCLCRFIFEERHRPVFRELKKICRLSLRYRPDSDIRPVSAAGWRIVLRRLFAS